jgi:tRNA(Ile)-lysidine synthase
VKREGFTALPPAFQRRLLRTIVDRAGAEPSALSLDQTDEALSFMAIAQTGRTMSMAQGLTITREYNQFVISAQAEPVGFSHDLAVPGITPVPEHGLEVEIVLSDSLSAEPEDTNYLWHAGFDYDKIGPHLTLRSRHSGDWFCPAGMADKSKKLQDYFVDEKVPRRKRNTVPLLCAGENILWVVGLRTDQRFLVGAETKKTLVVTVRSVERGVRNG